MICLACKQAADEGFEPRHNDCYWKASCTCQHKRPGAWEGKNRPASVSQAMRALTPGLMSVSQALKMIRDSRPSQCSVCERRVALTPKSGRIVRHKRRRLVTYQHWDGTERSVIRNYPCPGSGRAPQPAKDIVPSAISLLELGDDA